MRFRQSLAALAFVALAFAQEVPRPAAKFAIKTVSGSVVSPSQYPGKVVLLAFMFTTCPHRHIPRKSSAEFRTKHGDRGLQILGAFFNDNAAQSIPEFVTKYKPDFPVGYVAREKADVKYCSTPSES